MKNGKYHTVGTVQKSNRIVVEKDKLDTPNTHRVRVRIHDPCDRSLYLLGTGTSINNGGVKLVYG